MTKNSTKKARLWWTTCTFLGDVGQANVRNDVRLSRTQSSHDRTERWMIGRFGTATLFASVMAGERRVDRSGVRVIHRVIHRTDDGCSMNLPCQSRQVFAHLIVGQRS